MLGSVKQKSPCAQHLRPSVAVSKCVCWFPTLLAQQHFESFRDRFADWPVTVEVLSRFKTAKETKAVIDQANKGHVDIVVGTHKLLSSDLRLPKLGILIIDEEHRFGVAQKERLKKYRSDVDVLTLTATPIPRHSEPLDGRHS